MSIRDLNDWNAVELKAQTHELSQVDTPKVPVTPEQQWQLNLAWARCAELQARLHRKNGALSEAIMWLAAGDSQRALEVLNRALLDL